MYATIAEIGLIFIKFFFELNMKKKLTDEEFLNHIKAHQEKKANIAQSTDDFEDELDKL